VSQDEIDQADSEAQNHPDVIAKKTDVAKNQAALEQAETQYLTAHSSRLDPNDMRVSLRVNPDTGGQRITGNYFVDGDPVHQRLLTGVSQVHSSETTSARYGYRASGSI
jgi:hypothetical protein